MLQPFTRRKRYLPILTFMYGQTLPLTSMNFPKKLSLNWVLYLIVPLGLKSRSWMMSGTSYSPLGRLNASSAGIAEHVRAGQPHHDVEACDAQRVVVIPQRAGALVVGIEILRGRLTGREGIIGVARSLTGSTLPPWKWVTVTGTWPVTSGPCRQVSTLRMWVVRSGEPMTAVLRRLLCQVTLMGRPARGHEGRAGRGAVVAPDARGGQVGVEGVGELVDVDEVAGAAGRGGLGHRGDRQRLHEGRKDQRADGASAVGEVALEVAALRGAGRLGERAAQAGVEAAGPGGLGQRLGEQVVLSPGVGAARVGTIGLGLDGAGAVGGAAGAGGRRHGCTGIPVGGRSAARRVVPRDKAHLRVHVVFGEQAQLHDPAEVAALLGDPRLDVGGDLRPAPLVIPAGEADGGVAADLEDVEVAAVGVPVGGREEAVEPGGVVGGGGRADQFGPPRHWMCLRSRSSSACAR